MTTLGGKASNANISPSDLDFAPNDNSSRAPTQAMGGGTDMMCTSSFVRPNNCYWVTPRVGRWLVIGTWDFETPIGTSGGGDNVSILRLHAGGAVLPDTPDIVHYFTRGTGGQYPNVSRKSFTHMGFTAANLAAGTTIEMLALAVGSQSSFVRRTGTQLTVVQVG